MQFDNVKTEVVDDLRESSGSRISHIQRHGPQFHHKKFSFSLSSGQNICQRFQVCLFTELRSDRRVLEVRSWSVGSMLQEFLQELLKVLELVSVGLKILNSRIQSF